MNITALDKVLMSAGVVLISALPLAAEQELPHPVGDIILTVSGGLSRANDGNDAIFDLSMLQELPVVSFDTSTEWTEGVAEYAGVPLHALLTELGVSEGSITATAVNDYSVQFPFDEIDEDYPIVAYHVNGKGVTLREKGPLWIMYPFDHDDAFLNETIYSRTIWQLHHINVEKNN